jgi:hypothetical protein
MMREMVGEEGRVWRGSGAGAVEGECWGEGKKESEAGGREFIPCVVVPDPLLFCLSSPIRTPSACHLRHRYDTATRRATHQDAFCSWYSPTLLPLPPQACLVGEKYSAHTHTHSLSLSLTHTHSLSLSHTHTHTLSLSHTHTQPMRQSINAPQVCAWVPPLAYPMQSCLRCQ